MSYEIVPAEPIHEETDNNYGRFYASPSRRESNEENMAIPFTRSLTFGLEHGPEPFDSERLPPALASDIQRFLRVANLIESEEPRIAYLCRFHAFEIAHNMDKNSTGRGVRQFKTSLLQRLERDEETTINRRRENSDIRELRRVCHAYEDREKEIYNARRIASVLAEVLKTITNATGPQARTDQPSNILPLDQGGVHQPIMQLPEIKAALAAVRNTRGLPSAEGFQKSGAFIDLFEFLHYCFGFQVLNLRHQRFCSDSCYVSLIRKTMLPTRGSI